MIADNNTITPPLNGAMIFDTPDAMLAAMFGAPQHDRHVQARREHLRLIERKAWNAAADERVRACLTKMRKRDQAKGIA